ncbi:hypothetical protein D621_01380 [beta proteobacterium AAP51]|nr:hypothetical protein D621_01380 [beta proteobacterium AAP51]
MQASRQGRHDEAVAMAQQALSAGGASAAAYDVIAFCVQRRDGYAAARPHMLASLRLDVEQESAFHRLASASNPDALREAVDFLAQELRRQPLIGDGILLFQAEAGRAWPAQDVLSLLHELAARWPRLWQAPVALARQWLQLQQPHQALATLADAAESFPLLPRVHHERAEALRLAGRVDDALEANARAVALSPAWSRALRLQVDLLCKHQLRWNDAEPLLQRALQTRDGWADADLAGLLAWVHEHQKRHADALALARRSLRLDPSQGWVWGVVRRLCDDAETPHVFDEVVDEVVATCVRAGQPGRQPGSAGALASAA